MNKLFFFTIIAVCNAHCAFSQDQAISMDKKTVAETGKNTGLLQAADSLSNPSANCVLDMKKTTDASNKMVLKNDHPVPKEYFLINAKTINSPQTPAPSQNTTQPSGLLPVDPGVKKEQ